jgi:hypothetical protein
MTADERILFAVSNVMEFRILGCLVVTVGLAAIPLGGSLGSRRGNTFCWFSARASELLFPPCVAKDASSDGLDVCLATFESLMAVSSGTRSLESSLLPGSVFVTDSGSSVCDVSLLSTIE